MQQLKFPCISHHFLSSTISQSSLYTIHPHLPRRFLISSIWQLSHPLIFSCCLSSHSTSFSDLLSYLFYLFNIYRFVFSFHHISSYPSSLILFSYFPLSLFSLFHPPSTSLLYTSAWIFQHQPDLKVSLTLHPQDSANMSPLQKATHITTRYYVTHKKN